jgi:membrane carboxypeptidase/penicillin-binding protein
MEGGTAAHLMKSYINSRSRFRQDGTSSNYSDAWFVGYTSDMVTAVWVGNKKGAISLGEAARAVCCRRASGVRYAAGVYRDYKPDAFIVPEAESTRETICLDFGTRTSRAGPVSQGGG